MLYLSSPYTHEYPEVMGYRYEHTMEITAHLMKLGIPVFSPIVHCHPLALKYNLPKDYKFWEKYNKTAIDSCYSLMIAAIDGWEQSLGVKSEYDFAVDEGKTVGMITPLLLGGYAIAHELSMNPFI